LKTAAGFRNNLVLAGISSLAFAALAPLPTLAAPGITLKYSFVDFALPYSALTPAGNGLYYGTTPQGEGGGNIFLFDSATGIVTFPARFDGTNGAVPFAAMTAAGNGIYYGTTSSGGTLGSGTVYKFDSTTGSIITQDSFTRDQFNNTNGAGSNGGSPWAALTAAGNGLYYGTTKIGGAYDQGAIFSFDSATGSITLQGSFAADGSNGANPYAALTPAGNGLYYGTTFGGGANGQGAIFAFDPANGSITLQASFDSSNGSGPYAALTAAGNGLYYGTTFYGGANNQGAIFSFDSATGSITILDSFDGSNGADPSAALTAAGNGLYYGTTRFGGANGGGTIFAFDSGVRDANPVPGPLPLMGAGAAFGWSRRLRRRIQPVRPVFPIGR
jgi:uncharacterized repeat protein (TIGR03803 family)